MGIFDLKPYDWGDYLTVQDVTNHFGQAPPYIDFEAELFKFFRIEILYPHNSGKVDFKAFITNYSESFNSQYSPESVYGRMDQTMFFNSTQRNLNLSWTCPAASVQEAVLNLQNTSKLARMMYPVYGQEQGFNPIFGNFQDATDLKAPPRVILRFANLVKRTGTGGEDPQSIASDGLHGVITSYSWQPVIEDGFFDGIPPIAGASFPALLPKTISVSISYTVTHRDVNGWGETGEWLGDPGFPWLPGEPRDTSYFGSGLSGADIGGLDVCQDLGTALTEATEAGRLECVTETTEAIETEGFKLIGAK